MARWRANNPEFAGRRRIKTGPRGPRTTGFPEGVLLDPEDRARLEGYYWRMLNTGYVIRRVILDDGRIFHSLLHREVLGVTDPAEIVDHINGNRADCRKGNLRVVDPQMSAQNRKRQSNNTSGHTGVRPTASGKFVAEAKLNRKPVHLGTYDTFEAACIAADAYRWANYAGYTGRSTGPLA